MLTKDQILSVDDLPKEEVPVPEWGGSVFVRTLRGEELSRWQDMLSKQFDQNGKPRTIQKIMATLVCLSVCDELGERLFTDSDVDAMDKKSAKVIQRLFDVAKRLSGLTDDAVKDLEKN